MFIVSRISGIKKNLRKTSPKRECFGGDQHASFFFDRAWNVGNCLKFGKNTGLIENQIKRKIAENG